jgi:excisionase family DNA binding protein
MDKLLLTPVEAAAALGIGRSKVYELMRAGTLASIRIDSCRRVPLEDLTALIAKLRSSGGTYGGDSIESDGAYGGGTT